MGMLADPMPGAQWFRGSSLSFAGYLLSQGASDSTTKWQRTRAEAPPSGPRQRLREETAALASTLTDLGDAPGDAVVGYLPNIPEAIVSFLAIAALGATWSCVGRDYAAEAALDRFGQLEPKVLITSTGYSFNGKGHDPNGAVAALQTRLPSRRMRPLGVGSVGPGPQVLDRAERG